MNLQVGIKKKYRKKSLISIQIKIKKIKYVLIQNKTKYILKDK